MDHEFPEGFKAINIESYDGTTDPAVWIEDFILHIHMARGDDLHAIKYLPINSKGKLGTGSTVCLQILLAARRTWKRPSSITSNVRMFDLRTLMT